MSHNRILSRFCRCGDLASLSRRFHNLPADQKRMALELIDSGVEPVKALRKARRNK